MNTRRFPLPKWEFPLHGGTIPSGSEYFPLRLGSLSSTQHRLMEKNVLYLILYERFNDQ
jgi:hypothetical protein